MAGKDWLIPWRAFCKKAVGRIAERVGIAGGANIVTIIALSGGVEAAWDHCKSDVYKGIADAVRDQTGMNLDPNDPLSDESLSAALTQATGVTIHSVYDRDVLIGDLETHVSDLIEERTRWKNDLGEPVAGTGVRLKNILNPEDVKTDVRDYVRRLIIEKTRGILGEDSPGIDIGETLTFQSSQTTFAEIVKDNLAVLITETLKNAAEYYADNQRTVIELLAVVDRAHEATKFKARDAALGTAAALVARAYAEHGPNAREHVVTFKRRLQNRESQRRFREIHGNRMRYNPLPKQSGGGGDGNGAGQGNGTGGGGTGDNGTGGG